MSAKPEEIYGENNLVRTRDALRYADETREDVNTPSAVRDEDVKSALSMLADNPVFIACIKADHRGQRLEDMGRMLDMHITIARAERLQWPMP